MTSYIESHEAELVPRYDRYVQTAHACDLMLQHLGGYTAHNLENLRDVQGRAVILAPNHRANVDSIALGLTMFNLPELTEDLPDGSLDSRPVHFMAKKELWRYPGIRQVLNACGAFAVERGKGVGLPEEKETHVSYLLENDAALCIYPEGTRLKKDKHEVHRDKLKSTIAFLALKYGVALLPVGIAGPGGLQKYHRELVFERPLFVDKHPDEPGTAAFNVDKHAVMDELHDRINTGFLSALAHVH